MARSVSAGDKLETIAVEVLLDDNVDCNIHFGRVDDGSHFWTADFEAFDEVTRHCSKLLNNCEYPGIKEEDEILYVVRQRMSRCWYVEENWVTIHSAGYVICPAKSEWQITLVCKPILLSF